MRETTSEWPHHDFVFTDVSALTKNCSDYRIVALTNGAVSPCIHRMLRFSCTRLNVAANFTAIARVGHSNYHSEVNLGCAEP